MENSERKALLAISGMDPAVTVGADGQAAAFTKALTNFQAQEAQVVDVAVDRLEPIVDRHRATKSKKLAPTFIFTTRA